MELQLEKWDIWNIPLLKQLHLDILNSFSS